jgi:ribosomal protein S18 acetylase RimI-like enzyme
MILGATAEDAAALGRVHVQAWQESYPGIVPQAVLAAQDPEARAAMWRRVIAAGEDVWLARDEAGALLGFANAGPQREPDILPFAGEIYALYLLQAAKGRGLGRALMRAAARGLLARGIGAASLWVLDGNQAAQGFYAALGGQVVLRRPFPPPQDWDGHETAFAWPDLRVLAA